MKIKGVKKAPLIAGLVVLAVAIGAPLGYRLWQENARYVRTDNAQISAALVPVSSLASGRVMGLSVEIGDMVTKQERLVEIALPAGAGWWNISVGASCSLSMCPWEPWQSC